MELVRYKKMKEGEVVCEFETLWPDKVCKKVFELEGFETSVCDLAVEENDVQELYPVSSMEDIRKYEKPVTCRFDGRYMDSNVKILIDFNAQFLAVSAPKESICYSIAESVDWNWGDPE
ncbi:MAG: hypothetical protein IJI75_08460 [Solobacterium sp.]|nr:hypothetical protein [Solobacterium sp.]